jgi:hypothetical protein
MIEALIAILGLGVGDYIDPLNLNTEDDSNQVIVQESCTSTTTISNGQETKVLECKTMKTISTTEEKD